MRSFVYWLILLLGTRMKQPLQIGFLRDHYPHILSIFVRILSLFLKCWGAAALLRLQFLQGNLQGYIMSIHQNICRVVQVFSDERLIIFHLLRWYSDYQHTLLFSNIIIQKKALLMKETYSSSIFNYWLMKHFYDISIRQVRKRNWSNSTIRNQDRSLSKVGSEFRLTIYPFSIKNLP